MSDYIYYCDECEEVILDTNDMHLNTQGNDVHEACCDVCHTLGDHYYD